MPDQDSLKATMPVMGMDMALVMAIGELKGQVASLTDMMSRRVQSDDELSRAVAKLENLPQAVTDLKTTVDSMEERLRHIEQNDKGRTAQQDMLGMILKSPALGWLVGALTVIGGIITNYISIGKDS